jgi:hypothetical protein
MATYFTDFSTYTAGVAPTGWTERWDTAGSWQVVAGVGFGGSQGLQYVPGTSARHGLSWDVLDADPDRDNIEFLYRWSSTVGGASATNDVRVFARGSGVDPNTQANGYSVGPTNTVLRFVKYVAGTSTTTDTAGGALTANAWYWSRVRINGSTITQKMWADGTTEPTTWAQTITDTSVTGVGWAGVFITVLAATRMTYDQISIATAGATAPAGAPALTVSAGSDVTIPAGQTATITGTATSSGGTIATRAWTLASYVGGAAYTLSGGTTATVTFTPASPGKYTLRYTVTDSLGGTGSDDVTVYATTATEARPIATVSSAGWTAVGASSPELALADESDTTWVEAANPAGASILVDLAPAPVGAKTVNYRVQLDPATPGTGTWLVEYLSSGVVRASKNVTATTSGVVAGTLVLTDTQNATVTDPNNHQLRFTATTG